MSVVLVINPGCSSKRYGLFVDGRMVRGLTFEKTGAEYQSTYCEGGITDTQLETEDSYHHSFNRFVEVVKKYFGLHSVSIDAIGIRVVAPGSNFQKHHVVDDIFISTLRAQERNAPLHIPIGLYEIQQCRLCFPKVPLIAVSDTAFFAKLPPLAREYSLRRELVKEYDIHRFGYHGLSVNSVVERVHSITGVDPEKMVVCHIGSGTSVTGLVLGRPVYTSAGFATLNGVPMTTRAGDVDAGVALHLMRTQNKTADEVSQQLHVQGGLRGFLDTEDLRVAFDRKAQGDSQAAFAIELLADSLQKKIAEASVATGGIETLVLTGTVGFRSPSFRLLMTERLAHLGIAIDEDKNDSFSGREGVISPSRSVTKVVVMRTEEMREASRIALEQARLPL